MFRSFACIALITAACAGAAHAEDRTPAQMHVAVRAGDFTSADRTEMLYRRIQAAAHNVCDSEGVSDSLTANADRACEAQAVSDAVRQINTPELSRLDDRHQDRQMTSQAATLAYNERR